MRTPEPLPAVPVHRPELWVDAFSPPDGDGSRERPLRQVPQPLPAGARVHLRSGLYAGPFVFEGGVHVQGTGEVVLTGEAGQAVVTANDATLENLAVQGGATGLVVTGPVTASGLRFSGQRARAARVEGALTLKDAGLEASVEGIEGLVVAPGASLELTDARFSGGFRLGLSAEGARLRLRAVSSQGPRTLLRATGGELWAEQLRSAAGSGPALALFGVRAEVTGLEVSGHEYGLLVSKGAEVKASQVRVRGAQAACVAVTGASLALREAVLLDCGPAGAMSLIDATSQVSRLEVRGARELGVFVQRGLLTLDDVTVVRVTGSDGALGDALHAREAKVTGVGALTFQELDGSGVFASAFAEVRLAQVTVERARSSAFFVERKASLEVDKALVRGGQGPALVLPDDARARFGALFVAGGTESPVYAECSKGAEVTVQRLETTVPQVPSRCVQLKGP